MNAVTYSDYGGPEVLRWGDAPDVEPAADEVLIRVAAAGVNPIDARLRSGEVRWLLPGGFPRVPGYDVAGVVAAAGRDCDFRPGDPVMAFLDHVYGGGYAEFAVCSKSSVALLPPEFPFDEAAALPLAGSTALQSLRDHGKLVPGESVLVLGASGGVGAFAVQIAKARGATVTGVASGKHLDFVRSLGADDCLDYELQDYAETDRRWDLIFDAAGKSDFGKAEPRLNERGRYVTTEPSVRGLVSAVLTWPRSKQSTPMLARSRGDDLKELAAMAAKGELRVTVERAYPLSDAAEAHRRIEDDSFCGKLVLQTPPPA